jgi:hypothetical protein
MMFLFPRYVFHDISGPVDAPDVDAAPSDYLEIFLNNHHDGSNVVDMLVTETNR